MKRNYSDSKVSLIISCSSIVLVGRQVLIYHGSTAPETLLCCCTKGGYEMIFF